MYMVVQTEKKFFLLIQPLPVFRIDEAFFE